MAMCHSRALCGLQEQRVALQREVICCRAGDGLQHQTFRDSVHCKFDPSWDNSEFALCCIGLEKGISKVYVHLLLAMWQPAFNFAANSCHQPKTCIKMKRVNRETSCHAFMC